MNYRGFTPFEVDRWGSLVTLADPTTLPLGLAGVAKNVRYKPTSVATRFGVFTTLQLPAKDAQGAGPAMISAVGVLPVMGTPITYLPFLFDFAGRLWIETVSGLNALAQVTPSLFALPVGSYLRYTTAYGRAYMAFSDLLMASLAPPMVLDGPTRALDPISLHLMGESWAAGESYNAGDVISPVPANGHLYRVGVAVTVPLGANQPIWPLGAANGVDITGQAGPGNASESTPSAASSGSRGNICTGTRWMVILYQNRNGYIQGMDDAAPIAVTPGVASRQLAVSNIPVGPTNIARRIVAFTVAGASPAGPYFYIPQNDSGSGVSQTATVLADNGTTLATFNFTDDFLAQGVDVTDYFRKIRIERAVDIYYAESLDRMIYLDPVLYPSGFLVSLPADPETVYGDTGVVQVANQDGGRAVCWREYRTAQYALKNNGGHEVTPNNGDPATWDAKRRWDKVGPCGPWAADAGDDILAFADRSGPYIWDGQALSPIGDEILRGLWDSINWTKEHLIWCAIDPIEKEVHFGVPWRDATVCNKEFVVSYRDGFGKPFRMSSFTGHLIALIESRKWSFNDIAANMGVRVERDISAYANLLPVPQDPEQYDRRPLKTQFLYASSSILGMVLMQAPGIYNDNGAGIDSAYQTGFAPQSNEQMPVPPGQTWDMGYFSLRARGSGALQVAVFADRRKNPYLLPLPLFDFTGRVDDTAAGLFGMVGNQFTALISNRVVPDCWFELAKAGFHLRPLFAGPRPTGGLSGPQ